MIHWSKHKAVVFESDDWGLCSITACRSHYEENLQLLANTVSSNGLETLETDEELENLFRVLESKRGGDRRPALFQPNYIVANPDFDYIQKQGVYREIPLPSLPERWKRSHSMKKVFEGIERGVWYPEYHGWNHYHYRQWIEDIKKNDTAAHRSLTYASTALWALSRRIDYPTQRSYYDAVSENCSLVGHNDQWEDIQKGLQHFQSVFDRPAASFIAPAYCWQKETERILSRLNLRIIQAKERQNHPFSFGMRMRNKTARLFHRVLHMKNTVSMGDCNKKLGIRYLVRNGDFEPRTAHFNLEYAYDRVLSAWNNDQPAILSSHRGNYAMHDAVRKTEHLEKLDCLLRLIISKDPSVVFLTDNEVSQLYDTGISILRFNSKEIRCRNYTDRTAPVHIKKPAGYRIDGLYSKVDQKKVHPAKDNGIDTISFDIPPGDYDVVLVPDAKIDSIA